MNSTIETLKQISNSENQAQLLTYMLEHIGHPDPYIRDTLIYSGFCEMILNDPLTDAELTLIATTCCDDEYLFFNMNERQGDAVLTRSFSALAIQLVLNKDCDNRFLPQALATHVLTKSIDYLKLEHDYRGYIENKGSAHSVAHGRDLLARAVSHPLFSEVATVNTVLTILEKCLCTDYAYIDQEDERMLAVIDALLDKGLIEADLLHWLEKLSEVNHDEHLKHYRIQWNIKKFMLSLYGHCIRQKQCETITNLIFKKYINYSQTEV